MGVTPVKIRLGRPTSVRLILRQGRLCRAQLSTFSPTGCAALRHEMALWKLTWESVSVTFYYFETHHEIVLCGMGLDVSGFKSAMSVKKISDSFFPTKHGKFRILGYEASARGQKTAYVVLVKGNLAKARAPLVRIHSQCLTGDVFASTRCDCGDQLKYAMRAIHKSGEGVIIYHPEEGRGIGLLNKLIAYELQDKGADTVEANKELGFGADERDYAACAQILKNLGISQVRLLSNNPEKMKALETAGLKVLERISIEMAPRRSTKNYLKTKKEKLGHLLTKV